MAGDSQDGLALDWGRVEVEPLGDGSWTSARLDGSPMPIHVSRYTWRPPPDLEAQLPSVFSLELDCYAGRDGVRRFVPPGGVPALILWAALGGYALLTREANPGPEQRFSYHATRLLYQKAPGLREHLDRAFAREADLYVPQAGRIAGDDRHVLPPDLGLDAGGQGTPWTPRALITQGRAEAGAAGHPDPDPATCIRLGLVAAARLNPLDPASLSEAEALWLVRLALFDLGPGTGPLDETLVDRVQERLWPALERHIDDDTEVFNHWFFENTDNIVHAIAKQKRGGGPVSRDRVRQVLLELVFRSFTYVGDCVHRQMTAFARALPDPLTALERAHFDTLYRKQPHLGGLPLVLLHDRFALLREAIMDVWDDPRGVSRLGILLRLLRYYGEMAGRRRGADRTYKARSLHRNDRNRIAQVLELDAGRDAVPEPAVELFQEIAAALRESRGASCRCGTTRHWRADLVTMDPDADPVVIEDACAACGHSEEVRVSRREIEEAGR